MNVNNVRVQVEPEGKDLHVYGMDDELNLYGELGYNLATTAPSLTQSKGKVGYTKNLMGTISKAITSI